MPGETERDPDNNAPETGESAAARRSRSRPPTS